MTQFQGLVTYVGYFLSFWNEILKYLFDLSHPEQLMWFTRQAPYTGGPDGQWMLNANANLPALTTKGEDIVAAIMTIVHNGIVAVAQLSTLLPANAL